MFSPFFLSFSGLNGALRKMARLLRHEVSSLAVVMGADGLSMSFDDRRAAVSKSEGLILEIEELFRAVEEQQRGSIDHSAGHRSEES